MTKVSRREAIVGALALTSCTLLPSKALAQTYDAEGKYRRIKPARVLEQSDKVEVVDVFWYGCSHCYEFLPHIEPWSKRQPDHVVVRRLPAIFRDSWIPHARAFYTAQVLGVSDEMHVPIFKAMHVDGRSLNTKEELMTFFAEKGVSEDDFGPTYDSFTVDSLARQAAVMPRRWGVQGTPSLIINGRYLLSGSLAGSYEDVIKAADVLIEKERLAMIERAQQS